MKTKKLLIIALVNFLISALVLAQAPGSFKYQAILRDASGDIKASTNANILIDILKDSSTGTNVYAETFTAKTNAFGLINLEIGNGTLVSGNFKTIDWSAGPYFVKISVDGTEMGISQLLSVPYALYATKAGNAFSGNYDDLTNKPTIFNNDLGNTATGYHALKNNSGYSNTAYGYGALDVNLTGNNNVAIGDRAIISSTSGYSNTAVGSQALQLDTSGSGNTAIGAMSLDYNTSGNGNTAIGDDALYINTSGNNNTAIGLSALSNNTSGYSNVAIGVRALLKNATQSNIVAIGDSALYNNGSGASGFQGYFNTAIGSKVLYSNTTGYGNTALGYNTMNFNTSGGYNTAIGFGTLNNTISGNSNTAIGANAGPSDGTLYNTGAFGYAATPTASNNIMIGNNTTTWIGGKVSWSSTSDARFKTNVKENVPGLDFILKLKPVTFNWDIHKLDAYEGKSDSIYTHNETLRKARDDREKQVCTGFLAQQVEEAAKQCAFNFNAIHKPENDKTPYSLSYEEFVVPLVKAVQEQQAEIELLKQQNKKFLQEINELKKK
jgi:trimeric autotransporter adhesin